jgi:hypothetical protein
MWQSHGTCSYIGMYTNAESVTLYLQISLPPPPPPAPQGEIRGAHLVMRFLCLSFCVHQISYRIYKVPLPAPVLGQMNPVSTGIHKL